MKIRSQEQWQHLFADHAASGLSAHQFCLEHNINEKYFSLRRKQLGWRDSTSSFARAVVSRSETMSTVMAVPLKLHYRESVIVFGHLPDPVFLAQLLGALS